MKSAAPLSARIRAARDRVRSATPRERVMLAALSTVGVLILLSVGIRLLRTAVTHSREVSSRVEKAGKLMEFAPGIDAALAARSAKLAGKRSSATDFLAAVDTLARESGLTAEAGTPRSVRTGGLTVHRLRLSLRAASLQKLMEFDDRLRLHGDGVAVERVIVESRSGNGELSAVYELATCQTGG